MKLDHIQLAIPADSERICRRFWIDLLGLRELDKPVGLAGRGGAWFIGDDVEVHLGTEPDFSPAKKAHPAFVVDDLDNLVAKLIAADHPVRWDEKIAGRLRFFTDDPVGNRIEFIAA